MEAMTKAYDIAKLAEYVKAEAEKGGITIAEEALEKLGKSIYLGSKQWAKDSAVLSETKIDDFFMPFYDQADPFVLPQIEKIDLDGDGK